MLLQRHKQSLLLGSLRDVLHKVLESVKVEPSGGGVAKRITDKGRVFEVEAKIHEGPFGSCDGEPQHPRDVLAVNGPDAEVCRYEPRVDSCWREYTVGRGEKVSYA